MTSKRPSRPLRGDVLLEGRIGVCRLEQTFPAGEPRSRSTESAIGPASGLVVDRGRSMSPRLCPRPDPQLASQQKASAVAGYAPRPVPGRAEPEGPRAGSLLVRRFTGSSREDRRNVVGSAHSRSGPNTSGSRISREAGDVRSPVDQGSKLRHASGSGHRSCAPRLPRAEVLLLFQTLRRRLRIGPREVSPPPAKAQSLAGVWSVGDRVTGCSCRCRGGVGWTSCGPPGRPTSGCEPPPPGSVTVRVLPWPGPALGEDVVPVCLDEGSGDGETDEGPALLSGFSFADR